MKNLEENLLKLAICTGYKEKGVDIFYDVIKDKEEVRKKSSQEEEFDNTEFELGYIYSKLSVIEILISLKTTKKNKKDREKLANILIETAEELRSIEGEN